MPSGSPHCPLLEGALHSGAGVRPLQWLRSIRLLRAQGARPRQGARVSLRGRAHPARAPGRAGAAAAPPGPSVRGAPCVAALVLLRPFQPRRAVSPPQPLLGQGGEVGQGRALPNSPDCRCPCSAWVSHLSSGGRYSFLYSFWWLQAVPSHGSITPVSAHVVTWPCHPVTAVRSAAASILWGCM